jgi:hypothetical protein
MDCCVCWEHLPSLLHTASFSTDGQCRSDHTLCKKCYEQCDSCPLCRFHPIEKPLIYAEKVLDELRNRKNNLIHIEKSNCISNHNEYISIVNEMDDIKSLINSISM